MPVVLAAALVALYFWSKKKTADTGGERTTLIPQSPPTAETRESFFGGDQSGREWWPELQTAIDSYMRDLFSGGELAPFAPRAIPPGMTYEPLGGAEAPLTSGTRVEFTLRDSNGVIHVLEGAYQGPSDPSEGPGAVAVDRISSEHTPQPPAFGTYSVPASKYKSYHNYLALTQWYAIDPTSVGLTAFAEPPVFGIGDKITGVFRDRNGSVVVGVATVRRRVGDEIEIHLDKVHKVIIDEGVGPITFSRMFDQAVILMKTSQLVNPTGL